MPNTLDFDVVFNELTRLHETGNIGVLSAIVTVLLLYLLVVVFARRADKRDKAKVKIESLCQLSLAVIQCNKCVFKMVKSAKYA